MAEGILVGLAGRPAGIARRITIRRSTAATQPPEPGRFNSADEVSDYQSVFASAAVRASTC